jgi:hypothetical protein
MFNVQRNYLLDYFECRLNSCDSRFAATDYLLWAQNVQEYSKLVDSISITLRKEKNVTMGGKKITAELVRDKSTLNEMLQTNLGYKFMASIRGSPAYW